MESSTITSFNKLPPEVQFNIFGFLSYKEVRENSRVCSDWKVLLDDNSIWKIFEDKLEFPFCTSEQTKGVVLATVKYLIKSAKKENRPHWPPPIVARIHLSRLGIGSLNDAELYAEQIEKSPGKHKNYLLNCIAKEYLKQNHYVKAEEMLKKMTYGKYQDAKYYCRKVAVKIFKNYLNHGDLESAHSIAQDYLFKKKWYEKAWHKKRGHTPKALILLLQKSEEKNNTDFALCALEKLKHFSNFETFVQDFFKMLCEKGEFDKSEKLKSRFPEAF